jgi:hypothetical protein
MMDEIGEQCDLDLQIDEPMNAFRIVHFHNRSDKYHLTRQVLLDSVLTQNTYCFFYHILTKNINEFNELYGSFAYLVPNDNIIEADLYLNVDPQALTHIIKYIQTGKINGRDIYETDWRIIDEIIDLATMFGMPNLVAMLRNLHPIDAEIDSTINYIKCCITYLIHLYKHNLGEEYPDAEYLGMLDIFLETNRDNIIDSYVKKNMFHFDSFVNRLAPLFINIFVAPLFRKSEMGSLFDKFHPNP